MSSRAELLSLWTHLEACFARAMPGRSLSLRPPTDEAAIDAAEHRLGLSLPADYRASLLVHDGQEDDPEIVWLPYASRLGSIESVVSCWQQDRPAYDSDPQRMDWLDKAGRTRQVHFHPKQIPIAGSAFWDYDRLLLDFVPGELGTPGQVIARADIELFYVCESLSSLLEQTVRGLESGRIVVTSDDVEYLSPRKKRTIPAHQFFR